MEIPGGDQRLIVIYGWGGCGKTTAAKTMVETILAEHSDCDVIIITGPPMRGGDTDVALAAMGERYTPPGEIRHFQSALQSLYTSGRLRPDRRSVIVCDGLYYRSDDRSPIFPDASYRADVILTLHDVADIYSGVPTDVVVFTHIEVFDGYFERQVYRRFQSGTDFRTVREDALREFKEYRYTYGHRPIVAFARKAERFVWPQSAAHGDTVKVARCGERHQ